MKNKRFLGKLLAVAISFSMATSAGAADFGDGTDKILLAETSSENTAENTSFGTAGPQTAASDTVFSSDAAESPSSDASPSENSGSDNSGTESPGVSVTPEPSKAPLDTETPDITDTPEITVTPGAELTPVPSDIPEPTVTPEPDEEYDYYDCGDGTVGIKYYRGKDTHVEIPSKIDGKPVSEIAYGAFMDQNLESVVIPEGVVEIGRYAFGACILLSEVSIPESVTKIGCGAFSGCISLTHLSLTGDLAEIEPGAFGGCGQLTLELGLNNPYYVVQDGAIFTKDIKTLVEVIGDKTDYIVPESVTEISERAFEGLRVDSVTVLNPDCVFAKELDGTSLMLSKTAVIKGVVGSSAESYAKEYGNEFEAIGNTVDISIATIALGQTSCTYTGTPCMPGVTITYRNAVLKENQDYTVTYRNNTDVGTASVTIKGTGTYTGTVTKTFQIVLGAPVLKTAVSASYRAAKITWNPVPGAKSYTLYYKGGNVKYWKAVKRGITEASYTHISNTAAPLTTGTTYTYTVKAVGEKTVSSCDTTGISVKIALGTVKLGKVTSAAYNKQKITWSKVFGATGYVVYQKVNGKWVKVGVSKTNSYINTNTKAHPVLTGVTNTYTVRAYRKVGKSYIYGGYSRIGISGKALLSKPVISKVTKTTKGLMIQWGKISGAEGYVIQQYVSGKWVTKKTIKNANTLTYTDTTAKAGTTCTYRVAAYCMVNGKPFYSVYSASKSGRR